MAMAGITLFLGMFLIGGISLVIDHDEVMYWTHLPRAATIALAAGCLAIVVLYATVGFARKKPFHLFGRELQVPRPGFALMQIVVSGIDWIMVASVLFVLLPHKDGFTFPTFLGVFVLAYLLGTLSNVPGGLGVFESIVLVSLTPQVPAEAVFSSLLVYRGVYNLLPLAVGGTTFLVMEFTRPEQKRKRAEASKSRH